MRARLGFGRRKSGARARQVRTTPIIGLDGVRAGNRRVFYYVFFFLFDFGQFGSRQAAREICLAVMIKTRRGYRA